MTDTADLLDLCHHLGQPARDLVVATEGNASMRVDDTRMLIKASGRSMETMTEQDLLLVDRTRIMTLLASDTDSDERIAAVYRDSVLSTTGTPSVEAILHAVIYDLTDAQVVAHTHPVAINAILCSTAPELLVAGDLFPDHVVALGSRRLLVPYVDPGVPLARAVRRGLEDFYREYGYAPRVIYLVNHGLVVLAGSTAEAGAITAMAVKAARVLHGTLAAGGPAFLPADQVARIEGRPDEQYRRTILGKDMR